MFTERVWPLTQSAPTRVGVVLEQALAPVSGGTGRYAVELTRALARSRGSRRVRTFTAWHRSIDAARIPGVDGPYRLPAGHRLLVRAWERGLPPVPWDVDLIHAPTLLVPWGVAGPKVVTIHDAVPWTHPQTLTKRGVRWHRTQAERAARDASAIIVPTRAVRDELAKVLDIACPVEVIGSAVSMMVLPQHEVRSPLPERYVVAVATLEPRKGLDILVGALARAECDEIPLVVVGQPGWGGVDGHELARLAGLADDRVILTGRVSDADLASIVSGADLLVMPSRSEGFGIPIIEAMHLGTAVVHTDVPALIEVADGAALCVPCEDPRSLAEAIARLWNDATLREQLVAQGKVVAAARTWDAVADAHWRVYEQAVAA